MEGCLDLLVLPITSASKGSLHTHGTFAQVICGHARSGGSLNHPMCIFITDIKNMTLYILVSVLTL